MKLPTVGQVVHGFLVDHLQVTKGLRPSSITSYRDGLRLFLHFVAADAGVKITALPLTALTADRVLSFLRSLENARRNNTRTRNQRLAMLRTFFAYVGSRIPEVLAVAEQVAHVPTKRVAPAETHHLDRTEIEALFARLPTGRPVADRDRALLLFLYNTGARVQEAADLRVGHLVLDRQPWVRLHGKGDKWRSCPLWKETAEHLRCLIHAPQAQRVAGTTNRYAQITLRTKTAALNVSASPVRAKPRALTPSWSTDAGLMNWLESL